MPWFKCFVHGKNFPGELIEETSPVGFYTIRFAEAASPEEAEMKALDELKKDTRLKLPDGLSTPQESRVYFEEIVEVSAGEIPLTSQAFVWYSGDESQT